MAIVAKPIEEDSSYSGAWISPCGKIPTWSKVTTSEKRAYIDTDYKLKVALGIPKSLLPYSISKSVRTDDGELGKFGSTKCSWFQCYGGISQPNLLETIKQAETEASQRFYKKISKQDTFNAAVAFAELGKTIGLIGSTAVKFASSYKSLRKGRVKEAFRKLGINDRDAPVGLRGYPKPKGRKLTAGDHRRALDYKAKNSVDMSLFAAQAWLEMQYGWKPLIYDIYGLAEHVAKLLYATDVDFIVKAGSKVNDTVVTSDANGIRSSNVEVICGYIAHLKVSDPELRNKASLGLTNPALLAWEITPLSFFVDWAYPIGAMIESFSLLDGFEIVASCKSLKVSTYGTGVSLNVDFPCRGTIRSDTFNRTIKVGAPGITLPTFDVDFLLNGESGWSRATTAFALLRSFAN